MLGFSRAAIPGAKPKNQNRVFLRNPKIFPKIFQIFFQFATHLICSFVYKAFTVASVRLICFDHSVIISGWRAQSRVYVCSLKTRVAKWCILKPKIAIRVNLTAP
jgi:hypothetical protein